MLDFGEIIDNGGADEFSLEMCYFWQSEERKQLIEMNTLFIFFFCWFNSIKQRNSINITKATRRV